MKPNFRVTVDLLSGRPGESRISLAVRAENGQSWHREIHFQEYLFECGYLDLMIDAAVAELKTLIGNERKAYDEEQVLRAKEPIGD